MIKLNKLFENLPIIIILIALLLLLANEFISKQMDFYIEITVIILFLLAFAIELYLDIKNRKYTISILIIIADIIKIVAFIALCYFNYKSIDEANSELLWERAENIRILGLIVILMPSIKSILKNQRLEKNNNS